MYLSALVPAAVPAALALSAVAAPAPAAVVYSVAGTTRGGPTFNRPDADGTAAPTRLSEIGTAVAYNTFLFAPAAGGTFRFSLDSTTPDFDPYLILYAGAVTPTAPLASVLVANDGIAFPGNLNAAFTRALAAGTVYTAVITGYNNGDVGTYALTISDAAAPVPEPATWALAILGLGLGLVGTGLRHRRRTAAVRFA